MEKYETAQMEIIEFDAEDVIATSSCTSDSTCYVDANCPNDGWSPPVL